MRAHTHTHTHGRAHTHTHTHTCTHTRTRTRTHTRQHTHTHTSMTLTPHNHTPHHTYTHTSNQFRATHNPVRTRRVACVACASIRHRHLMHPQGLSSARGEAQMNEHHAACRRRRLFSSMQSLSVLIVVEQFLCANTMGDPVGVRSIAASDQRTFLQAVVFGSASTVHVCAKTHAPTRPLPATHARFDCKHPILAPSYTLRTHGFLRD